MQFQVRFYQTAAGDKPVADFLDSLHDANPTLHKLTTDGLLKLQWQRNHGYPLTSYVDKSDKILELRVGSTDIVRIFFFFRPGQEIVCTNGYVKKSRKVDPGALATARRYKTDWELRNP